MSDEPHKERIWPVFVLAGMVVVFGTWLAFASPEPEVAAEGLPTPFITALPALEPAPLTEPMKLESPTDARRWAVDLRQQRTRDGAVVRTRLRLDVVESAASRSGDLLVWQRGFEDVHVTMMSNDQPLGADIAHDVERLLETVRVEVRARPTGEVVATSVVSAEAAQLGQLLSVLEDLSSIVNPRVPREAVRAGETWQWEVPITAQSPEDAKVEAAGKMTVAARVLGVVDGQAVLGLELTGTAQLDVTLDDERSASSTQTGTGAGVAVWDETRGLVAGDVRWEQTDGAIETLVRARIEKKSTE